MSSDELQGDRLPGVPPNLASFIEGVRLFLRDYPELNRLIEGEESNPRMIVFAVMNAVGEFNGEPPPLRTYTFQDFYNNGWLSYLLKGTVKHLLRSIALLQTRNQLSFSDGGISAQVSDKGPALMQYQQIFDVEWREWMKKIRISLNINNALDSGDGAHSEYGLLHGWNILEGYE